MSPPVDSYLSPFGHNRGVVILALGKVSQLVGKTESIFELHEMKLTAKFLYTVVKISSPCWYFKQQIVCLFLGYQWRTHLTGFAVLLVQFFHGFP